MAVDMFIKIGDIKGEAKDAKHKAEIDVLAYSWGMSNSGTTHMGGGGGSGKVSVQDLSFTKYVDAASSALMGHCASGKHIPEATLVVRKAGGDKALEYITVKMTDLLVTSVSTGGSGGEDRLTENVTLNFAKFEYTYKEQAKGGGQEGGDKKTGWNMAENVKV
ncbi:MAG: type VI secretion system tube protein Hcp [Rubrivivax sp.]|jgi:type VI secretion system secreted protein Hcp|nr:type VI secretion system tube protein Hcp [Rubrivivax sp.]